jgi:signal transduction histidine kinase
MTGWRTLALVVGVSAAGAAGTLAVGAATGMGSGDLAHLLSLLVPGVAVTVIAAVASRPLLARASHRQRFRAPALIAVMVALANLAVLTMQMFVSDHDATLVTALLLYSIGSGVGVALTLARSSSVAVERLVETAEALGGGDLGARAGDLGAGSELEMLARTLDDMARRLQAARARELALEGTRRDLITAVSHDLRTPLAGLRAMVEAIDDGVVEDALSVRRYVGEMRGSVLQLSGMVDDLFELAQLDAGAIEVETSHARLDEVVHSAVAAVEPAAQRKRLVLVADLGGVEDVPCSPRLTRVLQNLLGNAVRHTPADGTVRIAARRSEVGLELAVEDTGEGMTPEDLARVFDPFFRADPSRSGGGAGLGLALAKRIVETLGGRISAESTPAAGSRFAVLLPIS